VLPYTEDQPLQGLNPYDCSKSCTDLVAQMYERSFDLPVAVTRCGNLYGGGDLNWNRLVPGTIAAALDGRAPVLRSTGAPLRDYLYVEDAVDAYLQLAASGARGPWNFSTESPLSALEMTHAVLRACGRTDLEPVIEGTARNEIQDQYLSAEKARRELGWQPLHGLEEGLRRTVDWYRGHLGARLQRAA
jgi:CDP-glucose 4,6-dehydratase